MGNLFHPAYAFTDVWHIPGDFFVKKNIKYLILDIDNTLVADNDPYPDENAIHFLERLDREGIKYCFVSNNSRERVEAFNCKLNRPAVYRACKPLPLLVWKGMCLIHADRKQTAFIGDQLFTDMIAGNLGGIITILVNPINEKKETRFFQLKRNLENKIYQRIK